MPTIPQNVTAEEAAIAILARHPNRLAEFP